MKKTEREREAARRVIRRFVALTAVVLSACSSRVHQQPNDAVSPTAPSRKAIAEPSQVGRIEHHGIHAVYDTLAQITPSFVGLRYSSRDDRFVVGLTTLSDSSRVAGAVRRQLQQRIQYYATAKARLPEPRIAFEEKPVSWRTLSAVRDTLLLESAFDFPSNVAVDVDAGLVRIGLQSQSHLDVYQRGLAVRGSLASYVSVAVEQPTKPLQPTDLNGRFRPLAAGTRTISGCTLTAPGFVGSQTRVLTASHCTAYWFGPDGGPTQQPVGNVPFWGAEVVDLPTYRCGPMLNRRDCRRADIAAYTLDGIDLNFPELAFLPGLIARPTARVPGNSALPGPHAVSGTIQIGGTLSWAVPGEIVEKIGVTTGWTYGPVVNPTCSDIVFDAGGGRRVTVVCTDLAELGSDGGDSGSPILKDLNVQSGGDQVRFLGVASARNSSNALRTDYSSLNQIRQEIPTLCFAFGC